MKANQTLIQNFPELQEKRRIGWFSTNDNVIGFNIFPLSEYDKGCFPEATHRITSFKRTDADVLQWTNLVIIKDDKVRFCNDDARTYSRAYKIIDSWYV